MEDEEKRIIQREAARLGAELVGERRDQTRFARFTNEPRPDPPAGYSGNIESPLIRMRTDGDPE